DEAERLAEEGASVARELGAWFTRAGRMVQGTLWVRRGEAEAGLSILREGVAQYRSTGALYLLPLYLAFMADACLRLGRSDEGLATVAEALHVTETSASVF